MRRRLFEIIEVAGENDKMSRLYDMVMLMLIAISLVPLAFKSDNFMFQIIDQVCVSAFIFDYFLRWFTADYRYQKQSTYAFLCYPFSFMAIIDLLSILPSLTALNSGFKVLRVLRMMRAFRVFRVFKTLRYSKNVRMLASVFKKTREPLLAVGTLAAAYILISALIIYNVEPDSFGTFFDAIYWATVSLTTVGYGDIYPVTTTGRIVTMLSSVLGIAIVALPAGIITAGYMEEMNQSRRKSRGNDQP